MAISDRSHSSRSLEDPKPKLCFMTNGLKCPIKKWTRLQHNQLIQQKHGNTGTFGPFFGQNNASWAIGHKIKFGLWVSQGPGVPDWELSDLAPNPAPGPRTEHLGPEPSTGPRTEHLGPEPSPGPQTVHLDPEPSPWAPN